MVQVKLFEDFDLERLETEVNDYLAKNTDEIKVDDIKMTTVIRSNDRYVYQIMIAYEKK